MFTLGLNASREHVLAPGDIPVVQIDRGGQVTYHGPGQLVIYPLIDLRRHPLGVRELVEALENAVIAYAAELGVTAQGSREAPGVYVEGAKLASVGLRIRRARELPRIGAQRIARSAALRAHQCVRTSRARRYPAGGSRRRVSPISAPAGAVDTVANGGLTPHLLRQLKFAPGYSAINTDLQAVNSR